MPTSAKEGPDQVVFGFIGPRQYIPAAKKMLEDPLLVWIDLVFGNLVEDEIHRGSRPLYKSVRGSF